MTRWPTYPTRLKRKKVQILVDESGLDSLSLLEEYQLEGLVPCICMKPECDYWTELEPDQRAGWCEECDDTTLMSLLVLVGIL